MSSLLDQPVDKSFTKLLPKVELHAHLSGSISKATLHKIWLTKQGSGQCLDLEDPLRALQDMPDIFTFFKVFDQYIYKLIDDKTSLRVAVNSVIDDFEEDGVAYLELRTTPRDMPDAGIDKRAYVETVLEAIRDRPQHDPSRIEVHLLLSMDRRMIYKDAAEVLDLAKAFSVEAQQPGKRRPVVLGIDLCGNPMKGDVSLYTPLFSEAKEVGLSTTVHFAEVPESSTYSELLTILSWEPDRLGHVIHVPDYMMTMIQERGTALELCLSCNMIAKMVTGELADHHFGYWRTTANPLALSTDDVGVYESPLSNEYLLAARHFGLIRSEIIALAHRSIDAAFTGKDRMRALLGKFEQSQS